MTKLRIFSVLVSALLLLSCSSSPKQDQAREDQPDADDSLFSTTLNDYSRPSLEIPPDLLESAGERVQANAGATAESAAPGSGAEEVLPAVIGAEIQSDDDRSWLEIDAGADVVWKKLTEFWAFQEIDLVEYRPQAGFMETDWFARKGNRADSTGLSAVAVQLFDTLVSRRTSVDKFTIRLERDGEDRTRLFVTHRAQEKIARELRDVDKTVELEWVERAQDPEKIAQLLQAIVLLFDSSTDEPA
ncbi:MAG: outer membrane protein assembly factor BamC [Gammaproteobacteria bacterium]|nr:outer membrane protein assembly factor BamC [Gammaproteobacteria bacterium]